MQPSPESILKRFPHLKGPVPICLPQPLTARNPLSVSVDRPALHISHQWNHTLCVPLCLLLSLSVVSSGSVHVAACQGFFLRPSDAPVNGGTRLFIHSPVGGCVGDFQFGAVVVCAHFFWADTQRGIAVSGGAFFTFWGATSCLHRSDVCREVLGPAAPTCGSSPRCWVSGGDARAWAPHARSHWSVGLSSVGVHALHFLPALSK